MALVWKLLMLIAVLLLPFGMSAAPAAAMPHHSGSMPMKACPEHSPKKSGKAGFTECTMVCSAALPARELDRGAPRLIVRAPNETAVLRQLHGLHPDMAIPPPKHS